MMTDPAQMDRDIRSHREASMAESQHQARQIIDRLREMAARLEAELPPDDGAPARAPARERARRLGWTIVHGGDSPTGVSSIVSASKPGPFLRTGHTVTV